MGTSSNRRWSAAPGRYKLLANWAELYSKQTVPELAFEQAVSKLGHRYRFQHLIWKYIPDFALPDLKILVEIDGDSHRTPEAKVADAEKEAWLRKQGWEIVRFQNEDVLDNPSECAAEAVRKGIQHVAQCTDGSKRSSKRGGPRARRDRSSDQD